MIFPSVWRFAGFLVIVDASVLCWFFVVAQPCSCSVTMYPLAGQIAYVAQAAAQAPSQELSAFGRHRFLSCFCCSHTAQTSTGHGFWVQRRPAGKWHGLFSRKYSTTWKSIPDRLWYLWQKGTVLFEHIFVKACSYMFPFSCSHSKDQQGSIFFICVYTYIIRYNYFQHVYQLYQYIFLYIYIFI